MIVDSVGVPNLGVPYHCEIRSFPVMTDHRPLVAIVDDDPSVLNSLVRLLERHDFDAKPFPSAEMLLGQLEVLFPQCVVADLSMPGLSGLDLQRVLGDWSELCPIVFLTGHGDIRSSVEAMRAGAVDFLTKPFDQEELLRAVRNAVSRGRQARESSGKLQHVRQRVASLTQRERQVFELVVAGHLNKQIAAQLGISEKTVKVHRARVMRKMSVRSVAQLTRIAAQIEFSEQ